MIILPSNSTSNGRNALVQALTDGNITWQWHDSCGNCGCVANWHAFDIPEGATMVALPERFPCKGFEFTGCPHDCPDFVFRPAVATTVQPAHVTWETLKAEARARLAR